MTDIQLLEERSIKATALSSGRLHFPVLQAVLYGRDIKHNIVAKIRFNYLPSLL